MSNYPSQDHPSQQQPWTGRSRDEQFGRSNRDPYREQEFGGQRRSWQDNQGNRNPESVYGDSPYADREFYEQNPVSSNYGAYRGRSQHRNEPWPRNEDRENYSAAGDYGRRDFFEDNSQPSTGRYHSGGQDYGRGYGQGSPRYGQSYGGPGANYGQMQESARWREQQQGFRGYQGDQQPGGFYRQGNYGHQGDYGAQNPGSQGYGSQGFGSQRDVPQPGYFQAGDFSHQRGYTSSEYPEDTGYLYSAHSYSQGNQQGGRGLGTQNWQEREGAQRGAFGLQSTHRGRGPQGYTRSDERIKEDVCERLSEHHYIDASQIRVEVNQGVVTLEGSVDDRWQKYQTEDLVDSLSGVKDIQNRLNVSRASRQSSQWTSQPSAAQTASSQPQQGNDANAGKRNIADKTGDQSRGKPGSTTN